jgi:hypothetical protein
VRDPSGSLVGAGIAGSMARSDGMWLRHLAMDPGRPDEEAAQVLLAAVDAVRRAGRAGGRTGLCVPGPHAGLAALLAGGYRIFERDTFCSTDAGVIDPTRAVPDASFL